MRLSNPSSSDLGTYTWSQLQSAFPNGGAALAALPANTQALVVEAAWRGRVRPNEGGTRWSVMAPTAIVLDTTLQTGDLTGNNQIVKQAKVLAKVLRAGRKFIVYCGIGKTNTTDAGTSGALLIGSTGTLSDAWASSFVTMSAGNRSQATLQEYVMASATSLVQCGPANKSGWGGAGTSDVYLTARTVDDVESNDIWISLAVDIAGTTSAPVGYHLEVVLMP